MDYNLIHFKEIDSTNSYLKKNYQALDDFTFVSADYQSGGKGRNDRTWESESGQNLMLSFLVKDFSSPPTNNESCSFLHLPLYRWNSRGLV